MKSIDRILAVGKKVDPLIYRFLPADADKTFQPVLRHQISSGGKRVRAALTVLSCQATGGKTRDALIPAAIVELTHNYSLILDDVIDRGDVRRGLPTVRAQYSDAMAILAAMFYREVLDRLIEASKNPVQVRKVTVSAIKALIDGERLDILMEQSGRTGAYIEKHRFTEVRIDDYLHMIGKKTAALIKAACELGCIASNCPPKMRGSMKSYGWKIGLAFQVIDDYLDIFGEETGKVQGKDIIEHKLGNAVIMYALEAMGEDEQRAFLSLLRKEALSQEDLGEGMRLIQQTDARERTFNMGQRLVSEGIEAVRGLADSWAKKDLTSLAEFIGERLY